VGLSPLLAHNLGLLHQLQHFSNTHGGQNHTPEGHRSAAKPVGALHKLHLQVVQPAVPQQQQQQQPSVDQTARSVVICKVGQPLVTAFTGSTPYNSSDSRGNGQAEPTAANPDSSLEPDKHNSSSSSGSSGSSTAQVGSSRDQLGRGASDPDGDEGDELLQLLQAHFTQHTR
jgi:hypothetical protein